MLIGSKRLITKRYILNNLGPGAYFGDEEIAKEKNHRVL